MKIPGKMTADQLQEAQRIIWGKYYWLSLFNNYVFHRLGFIPLMLVVTVVVLASTWLSSSLHWSSKLTEDSTFGLAVLIFIVVVLRSRHPSVRRLAQLNNDLPAWVELSGDGVTIRTNDDVKLCLPWQKFKGWKTGETVLVLIGAGENYIFLPIASLSRQMRDDLLTVVSQHLSVC